MAGIRRGNADGAPQPELYDSNRVRHEPYGIPPHPAPSPVLAGKEPHDIMLNTEQVRRQKASGPPNGETIT